MKILVFGRSGQLARALAEELGEYQPIFVARPELDLEVPGQGAEAIAASGADFVINAAAFTAVDAAEGEGALANQRLNAEAPGELAAAAAAIGAPIVHVSTDYVFDGRASRPWREDDMVAPLGAYGRAKLAGERAVAAGNPRHLLLRTAWVISPWGRNFVRTMLAAAERGADLKVVADQSGSPTSASDLARGIVAVARHFAAEGDAPWGLYHLAGAGSASWHELAEATMAEAAAAGLPAVPVRPIATADWPTPAPRPANSELDSSRFAGAFDFAMPEWRRSLASIVARIAADRRSDQAA
ncbi:dTDP-4-dehydrorhamnose reductase [Sphingomonas mesophila]|uniref:dTDP-4-dehydrorhamnose reductase n=1 Tax=Sphingomonas mesophila TaxID=2303576 RepID=UPI000E57CF6D|nr:dTDP-4-dehydrorhamnose reductase [Sphingomonas mesophila]